MRKYDRSFPTWRPDNDYRDHLAIDRFFGTRITERNDGINSLGMRFSDGMLPCPGSLTSVTSRVASASKQTFGSLNSIWETGYPVTLNRFHQAAKSLSETGQNNIRILRGWAKSKGWEKLPNPEGRPEKWGIYQDGKFEWRLRIKPEPSLRENLHIGSGIPRFDARLGIDGNQYINPFTRELGNQNVGTHVSLE